MKLDQLYYFSEAAKYRSISIAAEKNYISQPTLSGSINKLERELGTTLLHRSSRGVTPTEIGEVVLEKTHQIFDNLEEIEEVVALAENRGTVRIAGIPCISDRIIPQTILRLKELDLDVLLSMTSCESIQAVNQVASGEASLGLVIHYSGIEKTVGIHYQPLFRDEYILYVGPFSSYWDADAIRLDQALAEPYIAYGEEFKRNNGGLTEILGKRRPNIVLRTDENEGLKRMIAQDNYVAFFPRFMSRDDFYYTSGLLRGLPISDAEMVFEVGVVTSTKYKIDRVSKVFLDILNRTINCDSEIWPCIN
ncbi:LysR family transcriptional regulator [Peptococcus simiae]|uniref:LysR family transcriptional regulator n=1 Tax=Peptococcus simiae TaxID=1643805 RepID=UPI00397EE72A